MKVMSQQKIEEVVLDIITKKSTDSWDSFEHMEIMLAIEKEFGIKFSEEELGTLDNATQIAQSIRNKYAS